MISSTDKKPRSRHDDSGRSDSEEDAEGRGFDAMDEDTEGGDTEEDTENDIMISRAQGMASDCAVVKWTYKMVEDSTVNQPHIVSWNKGGDAFIVMDIEALQDSVLGNYFITKRYDSFQRQMRNYGFERRSGLRRSSSAKHDPTIFKHKYFKRGCTDLLSNIKKKTTKSPSRKLSNVEDDISTLRGRLASMEEIQAQLRLAIENLKDANTAQKMQITRLESKDEGKNQTIEAMNSRIRSLESGLQSVIGPRYEGRYVPASPWHTEDVAFQPLSPSHRPSPPFPTSQETPAELRTSLPAPTIGGGQIDDDRLPPDPKFQTGFMDPLAASLDDLGSRVTLSRQTTDQSWLKNGFPDVHADLQEKS